MSNLFVTIPTVIAAAYILRHEGTLGVLKSAESISAIGAFLHFGVIKSGRRYRNIKPPEPKARRAKELWPGSGNRARAKLAELARTGTVIQSRMRDLLTAVLTVPGSLVELGPSTVHDCPRVPTRRCTISVTALPSWPVPPRSSTS
jgi:hypothetical protein